MFTGIIEEVGTIESISGGKITVRADKIFAGLNIGDSVAVNGVCLTVCQKRQTPAGGSFTADVMGETIRRTALAGLGRASRVNLERAMAADGRFGGHIVQGHVDGVGHIEEMKRENNAVWVKIGADKSVTDLIVEKGSIAIDGISLTVAYVADKYFAVSVIPHTGGETTLLEKKRGDMVNLECDIVGKYIKKFTAPYASTTGGVSAEFLAQNGFI